jgi:hypothetical protein
MGDPLRIVFRKLADDMDSSLIEEIRTIVRESEELEALRELAATDMDEDDSYTPT